MEEQGIDLDEISRRTCGSRRAAANLCLYVLAHLPSAAVAVEVDAQARACQHGAAEGVPAPGHRCCARLYLTRRVLSHIRKMDFSIIPGKTGYYVWRIGLVGLWQKRFTKKPPKPPSRPRRRVVAADPGGRRHPAGTGGRRGLKERGLSPSCIQSQVSRNLDDEGCAPPMTVSLEFGQPGRNRARLTQDRTRRLDASLLACWASPAHAITIKAPPLANITASSPLLGDLVSVVQTVASDGLGTATGTACDLTGDDTVCALNILSYRVATDYRTPENTHVVRVTGGVINLPTIIDASGDGVADMQVLIQALDTSNIKMTIERLVTAPQPFPVSVEALVNDPQTENRVINVGYDTRATGAEEVDRAGVADHGRRRPAVDATLTVTERAGQHGGRRRSVHRGARPAHG